MTRPDRAPNPRPPFLLGVTGKMSFPGYDDAHDDPDDMSACERAIYDRVGAVLDWLRHEAHEGALDPATGRFVRAGTVRGAPGGSGADGMHGGAWRGVGLRRTPIVLLTSLAPGVDTIAAEAALDYARRTGTDVSVRAPLPFPLEVYRRASTFRPSAASAEPDAAGVAAARLKRLDGLLARIEAQPGFVRARDLFCVDLDDDLAGEAEDDLTALSPSGEPRRRLRYRAAGEYVAVNSQLLLAAYDERHEPEVDHTSLFAAGTPSVVEAKRLGASFELLASANQFAWVDNGPVLHLPLDTDAPADAVCLRPLAFLHPYDTQPHAGGASTFAERARRALLLPGGDAAPAGDEAHDLPDDDPAWQRSGDDLFRRIARRHEEFSALETPASAADAWRSFVKPDAHDQGRAELALTWGAGEGEAEEHRYLRGLDDLLAARARAGASARATEAERARLLALLARLILVAAIALGMYEHWTPAGAHAEPATPDLFVHGAVGLAQVLLLAIVVACMAWSGLRFFRYRQSGAERLRFDHRAVAEGLRVQFWWCATGIHAATAAEYMQRQRGELVWIRQVLNAATLPCERWFGEFAKLSHAARCNLFHAARVGWVRGQLHWTRGKARANQRAGERWHGWGWALAAGGLLNVIGQLAAEASPRLGAYVEHHADGIAAVLALLGLLALGVRVAAGERARRASDAGAAVVHDDDHEGPRVQSYVAWIALRPGRWGYGLVAGALAFWSAHHLATWTPLWPDAHGWWIILTGVLLLAGAMCLAWSERNFHGENARTYRALESLCAAADRRLALLLARLRASAPKSDEARRAEAEIQAIYYEFGREALSENAEWLIQHRTRPLEPFMAG